MLKLQSGQLQLHQFLLRTRRSGGTAHEGGGGATSQLDLPSLTPLSVAGCGQLQLGVPHWATSSDYCKQLMIEATFCGSIFCTGRLLAIEDFTLFLRYTYNSPTNAWEVIEEIYQTCGAISIIAKLLLNPFCREFAVFVFSKFLILTNLLYLHNWFLSLNFGQFLHLLDN